MPRVQYVIADANGVHRGHADMKTPKRMALLTEWLKSASRAIPYNFKDWTTFQSYASTNMVYYDLRQPKHEFKATLVIDRSVQ